MQAFTLRPAPTLVFGEGESRNLEKYLKDLGIKKAAIVHGKGTKAAGLIDPILDAIKDIPYITSDAVLPESPDTAVQAVRDALYGQDVDAVIAIGGGSCIDTARAAMLLSRTQEPVTEFFTRFPDSTADDIKFICIPTTAGTGAEMSPGGPITNTATHVKSGLFCGFKMTDLVILDPGLTLKLSPFTTYTCAMDALCHALEAMTGKMRNAMTDVIAGQAVKYVWEALPVVMDENPEDLDARGKLLLGSNMAIGCQNLRHLGHAVCQPIGGRFRLPHGYTCALVLPPMLEQLADVGELKGVWMLLSASLGLTSDQPAAELAARFYEMNHRYGIVPLKEKGISLEEALACTDQILADGRLLPNCPKAVSREMAEAVILSMVEGR